jgi:hypothetical protein
MCTTWCSCTCHLSRWLVAGAAGGGSSVYSTASMIVGTVAAVSVRVTALLLCGSKRCASLPWIGDGVVMKLLLVPWNGSPQTPACTAGTFAYSREQLDICKTVHETHFNAHEETQTCLCLVVAAAQQQRSGCGTCMMHMPDYAAAAGAAYCVVANLEATGLYISTCYSLIATGRSSWCNHCLLPCCAPGPLALPRPSPLPLISS